MLGLLHSAAPYNYPTLIDTFLSYSLVSCYKISFWSQSMSTDHSQWRFSFFFLVDADSFPSFFSRSCLMYFHSILSRCPSYSEKFIHTKLFNVVSTYFLYFFHRICLLWQRGAFIISFLFQNVIVVFLLFLRMSLKYLCSHCMASIEGMYDNAW